MKKFRILAVLAVIIGVFVFAVSLKKPGEATHIFADLSGPHEKSTVPERVEAQPAKYRDDADSDLAVLLTDMKSDWLGLAHGFKSAGIPFSITTDINNAIRHKVVMVYPVLSANALNAAAPQVLAGFVRNGGTLIGFAVQGDGMPELFGYGKIVPLKARFRLKFTNPASDADALEKVIPIDNPKARETLGAYTYTQPAAPPLAAYEDGGAAIIDHKTGAGRAVAFGFDLGALLLRGYNNRQENMARSYDNGYELALDVLLRLVETIYRQGDDRAVTLAPVPDGKKLAVILTHDIDYTRSLMNAIDYAQYEHDAGIRATYFMQTKYIRDYNDDVILTSDSPVYLKKLQDIGMEIASHTVSHSRVFAHFPMGDGMESYPAYHPFVENKEQTTGGTIMGELRVSRFLIEQLVPGVHIDSFRPGYLSDPYALPQALVATGYKFSSSVTANDSLTHLPFQLTYGRDTKGEVPVFEFPITLADGPPLLTDRLPEGVDLAKKIARHGGLFVVLIHPDTVEPKLGFEKQLVTGVKDFSWFGTMRDFGRWWTARNAVHIGSRRENGNLIVEIKAPLAIEGLTLIPPAGMHLVPGQPLVKESVGQVVVLEQVEGTKEVVFRQ